MCLFTVIVSIVKLNLKIDVVGLILDGAYAEGWEDDTLHGASRDAIRDALAGLTLLGLAERNFSSVINRYYHYLADSPIDYEGAINLNLSGQDTYKLTNMINPTANQDYCTKAYHHANLRTELDSFPFTITELSEFTLEQYWYNVLNSSTGGLLNFYIKAPETRADWKLEIFYGNSDVNKDIDFGLDLGKNGNEETISKSNIHNGIAIVLSNIDMDKRYTYNSAVFSANKADSIQGKIHKNEDEGAGNCYILGVNLVY